MKAPAFRYIKPDTLEETLDALAMSRTQKYSRAGKASSQHSIFD